MYNYSFSCATFLHLLFHLILYFPDVGSKLLLFPNSRCQFIPAFTVLTPSPTLSTIPAPSWPRMIG